MTILYRGAILGLFTVISGLVIHFVIFQFVLKENFDVALLFKLRGPRQPPHDVVVVSMDKYSADKLNLP